MPPSAAAGAARPLAFPANARSRGKADGLARFSLAHESQTIDAGKTFLHEGDKAAIFFTVAEGTVELFKVLPDGRRAILGFLFRGDIFGFSAGDSYGYSAEAMTPLRLCRFQRQQLQHIYADFPGLESQILKLVSRELAVAQDHMVLLGRKTAHERVASFLLMLLHRIGRRDGWIELAMSRADIADYLGLTTETVSRVFTVLKASGCIVSTCSRVRISDADALAELAGGVGR
jgi:CRP/FNR family transcriptional regulator